MHVTRHNEARRVASLTYMRPLCDLYKSDLWAFHSFSRTTTFLSFFAFFFLIPFPVLVHSTMPPQVSLNPDNTELQSEAQSSSPQPEDEEVTRRGLLLSDLEHYTATGKQRKCVLIILQFFFL